MRHDTDIGRAFETLKEWMKQHQKPADKLGMTYEEWEERFWIIFKEQDTLWIYPSQDALLNFFNRGLWPYAAFKKIENRKS